jgi:hypothetical protein
MKIPDIIDEEDEDDYTSSYESESESVKSKELKRSKRETEELLLKMINHVLVYEEVANVIRKEGIGN